MAAHVARPSSEQTKAAMASPLVFGGCAYPNGIIPGIGGMPG